MSTFASGICEVSDKGGAKIDGGAAETDGGGGNRDDDVVKVETTEGTDDTGGSNAESVSGTVEAVWIKSEAGPGIAEVVSGNSEAAEGNVDTGGGIGKADGGNNGIDGGGGNWVWTEFDTGLKIRGSYLAVENGSGRPSEVVLTFWVVCAVPDCTGKATRLFKFNRGFVETLLVVGGPVGIGGGSFQPGS